MRKKGYEKELHTVVVAITIDFVLHILYREINKNETGSYLGTLYGEPFVF